VLTPVNPTIRRNLMLGVAAILALGLGACSKNGESNRDAARNSRGETARVSEGFSRVIGSQQIPVFDYSQERQTLIDVMTVRAEGAYGTAEVTALDGSLIWWCPTAGAPIPSTYQLTSPDQFVEPPDRGGQEDVPMPQGEPTGVYTGDSQATYVLCLDDDGNAFARYEEGNVRWTAGVIEGLPGDRRARVDEITFEFTTEEPGG
jgi:hypothetical protein